MDRRRWLNEGLSLMGGATVRTTAKALGGAGRIAMFQGDYAAAKASLEGSLAL